MGAAASSSGSMTGEQVCFGYWDTSTNSIHMVRLNSTDSTMTQSSSSTSSLNKNMDDVATDDSDEESGDNVDEAETDESHFNNDIIPVLATYNKGRKLSTELPMMPKRFKLRHNGYARLQCSSPPKENVERRLSGVKLQEMESVTMPLKAAKVLVGDPMRLKIDKEHSDSDDETDTTHSGHFDIMSVCQSGNGKGLIATSTGGKHVRLPQINMTKTLVQSSKHSATILASTDTQITMVLPKKAAKLLLGDGQVKKSTNGTKSHTEKSSILRGRSLQATLSFKPSSASQTLKC